MQSQSSRDVSASLLREYFASLSGGSHRLLPRWLFLRALGVIYFSAFYSLLFQIRGLIGPTGILPAQEYLTLIAQSSLGHLRFWYAPSLLWITSGSHALLALSWIGILASIFVILNIWPRGSLLICFLCFLSFVSTAEDFSGYQSDGMLLEAGFISLFLAPRGLRPGLGAASRASPVAIFLLQWEWFRIYFESGIVKLASGDPQWRNFTAMDEYYQNGPLPTWIGWYVQHLPHSFHAATVAATLALELGLVWMFLFPRHFRNILFCIVTVWELGVILTANYAFLNYLVLALGVLLVDDSFLRRAIPSKWRSHVFAPKPTDLPAPDQLSSQTATLPHLLHQLTTGLSTAILIWLFYASTAQLLLLLSPGLPLPRKPFAALEPFRIANRYGLFAVMTRGRYEIEFQGSVDGEHWVAYPFRYKPQALDVAPKIFAPYQPRFDWNLWFASLGTWRENPLVPNTEVRLLTNDADVLSLFSGNPFAHSAPKQVRAVLWQYWFTSMEEKRKTGNWWRRSFVRLYAPTLQLQPGGKIVVLEMPEEAFPLQ